MKIAIIGAGNLGKSIAKGLITTDAITSLYLTRRNLRSLSDFEGYNNVILTSDNLEAVKQSDIIIFAVQPAHFESILNEIQPVLTDKHVLISTITGFSIAKMEDNVGTDQYIIVRELNKISVVDRLDNNTISSILDGVNVTKISLKRSLVYYLAEDNLGSPITGIYDLSNNENIVIAEKILFEDIQTF